MTAGERFLIDFPFIGALDKAAADIRKQLRKRTHSDLNAWDKYPDEIKHTAFRLNEKIKAEIWDSSIFLPDDPADIVFASRCTLRLEPFSPYIFIIENELGREIDIEFIEDMNTMKYIEIIAIIVGEQRKRTLTVSHLSSESKYF